MSTNAHPLALERIINAPVENVWRCWTDPNLLEQWFCPKPWYLTNAVKAADQLEDLAKTL